MEVGKYLNCTDEDDEAVANKSRRALIKMVAPVREPYQH